MMKEKKEKYENLQKKNIYPIVVIYFVNLELIFWRSFQVEWWLGKGFHGNDHFRQQVASCNHGNPKCSPSQEKLDSLRLFNHRFLA